MQGFPMKMKRGPEGQEQGADSAGKMAICESGAAESGAVGARDGDFPADLRAIIDAWPGLADAVKADILAMIRAADG